MVNGRRNIESFSSHNVELLQHSSKRQRNDRIAQKFYVCATQPGDSWSIVKDLFRHATPEIWWRLIPEKNKNDDISYATSVDSGHIYSLLIDVKILEKRMVLGVENLFVKRATLDTLVNELTPMRLQISHFRPSRTSKMSYYFCIDMPMYPKIKHFVDAVTAGFQLGPPATTNVSLRRKCRIAAGKLGGQESEQESEHESDREDEHASEQEVEQVSELEDEHPSEQETEQASDHESERESARGREKDSEQENLLLLATTALENVHEEEEEATDVPLSKSERDERAIAFALVLDFTRIPRYVRESTSDREIDMHDKKQFNKEERALAIFQAYQWGLQDPTKSHKELQRIAKAACTQISFDSGFKKTIGATQFFAWLKSLEEGLIVGEPKQGLQKKHKGSQKLLDQLEKSHPGYVRELFRYAQTVKGSVATFAEIAELMKAKSADTRDDRPKLPKLHRKQVAEWFKANGGVERSVAPRPLLNADHKQKRVAWAREHFDKMKDEKAPVAFLDEKWFYTRSRRKKSKQLPSKGTEKANYIQPKMSSRRHPVKVMYMGVVARPQESEGFDGRVFIKRVSRLRTYKKSRRNTKFHDSEDINKSIIDGAWRDLYRDLQDVYGDDGGMTVDDLLLALSDFYELTDEVAESLELSQFVGRQRKALDDEQQLSDFDIDKLDLTCWYPAGYQEEEDVTCDSQFMQETMGAVGRALREKYHWVAATDKIYLVMDNAGGHGTRQVKEDYRRLLEEEYNVEIIWQVPRSPETNMLDLGVWMSIQNRVEDVHFGQRSDNDALSRSIENAWDNYLSPKAFTNVWRRLRVVLVMIVQDNGGNDLVESSRGKLNRDPVLENEHNANASDNDEHNESDNDNDNDIDEDEDDSSETTAGET